MPFTVSQIAEHTAPSRAGFSWLRCTKTEKTPLGETLVTGFVSVKTDSLAVQEGQEITDPATEGRIKWNA